jgi:type III restriction enzyme
VRLLLKDFQRERVTELVRRLRQAAGEGAAGDLQAVSLASPTGSGKTVMVTAALEDLVQGNDVTPPNEEATFLWISDQPELNIQTRRKMLATSSLFGPTQLVIVDAAFDQATFAPGTVLFLNTQKLGKNSLLVGRGDKRTYALWDTISNTVAERPGAFFVIIDEAHRGMAESARARDEANSIIQKFIKGAPGEIPPIPLIVGMSATPERFHNLIAGTQRTQRPVVVEPEEVRDSGLLKERITLYHPTEDQPSDMTMLRAAAQSWQQYTRRWAEYCASQQEPPVRPVLVVQVQDGTTNVLSRTDLGAVLRTIDDEVGPLPTRAFAHAFQDGNALAIDGRELRYLAPADIDGDPEIQVILFKTSLNTGWDCPRAEVMMSFRTASDATLIAQLIGRMVRTPLARRIDVDESLNSVALYLPHYDEKELASIITRLTTPDPDILTPVEVTLGEEALLLHRAEFTSDVFALLERLPSYQVPTPRKTSQVRRLMKLARLLARDSIDPEGPEHATAILQAVLDAEHERLQTTEPFRRIVDERGRVDIRAVAWELHGELQDKALVTQLDLAAENLDELFDAAGRKLGEGLHKAWWKEQVNARGAECSLAKLELVALCTNGTVLGRIETSAQTAVQEWLARDHATIARLPESRRLAYDEIRRLAADPEQTALVYPETIEGKRSEKTWKSHLYVDGFGLFPAALNRWETAVMNEELAREDVAFWLRNPDRKPWSLCVPYDLNGVWRPLYPDFLVVRRVDSGLTVDLLDPHMLDLADAPAKAAGLAKYAAKHAHEFGRIELIIIEGDRIKRLNLVDERVRDRVRGVSDVEHLRQLFDLANGESAP